MFFSRAQASECRVWLVVFVLWMSDDLCRITQHVETKASAGAYLKSLETLLNLQVDTGLCKNLNFQFCVFVFWLDSWLPSESLSVLCVCVCVSGWLPDYDHVWLQLIESLLFKTNILILELPESPIFRVQQMVWRVQQYCYNANKGPISSISLLSFF